MNASIGLRVVGGLVAVWATAQAQSLIEADRLEGARIAFDRASHAASLRCEFHPILPALSYSLQFQAGFTVDIPLSQFAEARNLLNIMVRVTPDGRTPVYLGMTGTTQAPPDVARDAKAGTAANVTGSFVVGDGSYGLEALVEESGGRTCYKQWRIQTRRSGGEADLKMATPPGTVRELAAEGQSNPVRGREIERLTVLMHATAMSLRGSKLEPETVHVLADSLTGLLSQLPAKSVRLAVFNLQKQAVLYSKEPFHAKDLAEVTDAIERLELAVVDFRTLQKRDRVDVLSDLVMRELQNPEKPDAVVIMGPRTSAGTGAALEASSQPAGGFPWFYLQYQPRDDGGGGRGGVSSLPRQGMGGGRHGGSGGNSGPIDIPQLGEIEGPDGIERLVHGLNGLNLQIRTPHDLAEAVRRMSGGVRMVESDGVPVPPTAARELATPIPSLATDLPEPKELTGNEDPVEVLALLRDRVLEHGTGVPNHTCVETVARDSYVPFAGESKGSCDNLLASRKRGGNRLRLDVTDWLRLDVGLADGREIFSWAGAAKFEEGEIDELIPEGAFGSGVYATLLLSVFGNRTLHYVLDGETVVDGRRVFQYSFRVLRDESTYRVKAHHEWLLTGYTGTVLVDPRTSDLVRFIVRTEELPSATQLCEVTNSLEYSMVPLGGFEYLLPKAAQQRFVGQDGTEGENRVTLAACREFLGESTLNFGRPTASNASFVSPGHEAERVPVGIPMVTELTTPFTLGEAAAGDRIQGKLTAPLRVAGTQKVVAPAGATVFGRLTKVELRHAGAGQYTVAMRWESLEIDGERVPITLKPVRQQPTDLKSIARGVLKQRGMEIELPGPGEEHDGVYHFPAQTTRVENALRMEWVTTGR